MHSYTLVRIKGFEPLSPALTVRYLLLLQKKLYQWRSN